MITNKKGKARTVLVVIAILIVLGLLTYFVVKGLSHSTGNVITNNGITYNVIANDERVTAPAKAASTNPDLPPYNPTSS
jgi:hypothetical protein